jgi:hypothetical protein
MKVGMYNGHDVCVLSVQPLKHLTNSHETWCEVYASRGCENALLSVIYIQ